MMETKHTAGPWTYKAYAGNHDFGVYSEVDDHGRDVALIRDFNEANARLIAAAPAMYEALVGLFAECSMTHKTWGDGNNRQAAYEAMKAANDAIALAEGREVTA